MIFNFGKGTVIDPIRINDADVEIVNKYKYLGVTIDRKLNWDEHCKTLLSKGNSRLYFVIFLFCNAKCAVVRFPNLV